jgi:hypothetical protein
MASTPFATKCDILSELWIQHKQDPDFQDFIEYNDLGLPLAYAVSSGIVDASERLQSFVEDTWDTLLSDFEIQEDVGFEELGEMIIFSKA